MSRLHTPIPRAPVVALIFTWIVFLPALFADFIIGDDYDQILYNPYVHQLKYIPSLFSQSTYFSPAADSAWGIYYRPLMLTVYSLIYSTVGPNPTIFHLVQISIHTLNTLLVYLLLRQVRFKVYPSAIGALLFGIHPTVTEAVIHIASLQDVLFVCLGLSGLLITLRHPKSLMWLLGVGLLQILALFAKETAIGFTLLTIAFLIWNHQPIKLFSSISLISTSFYLYMRIGIAHITLSDSPVSVMYQTSLAQRVQLIPSILMHYLSQMFVPLRLAVYQSWLPSFLYQLVSLACILIGIISLIYITSRTTLASLRQYFLWMLWIGIFLLPHLQIIPLYMTTADRWLYPALIGFSGLIITFYERSKQQKLWQVVILSYIICMAIVTFYRGSQWRDSRTLLEADNNKFSNDYFLKNLLASSYINADMYAESLPLLQASVSMHPFSGNLSNLGTVQYRLGNYQDADQSFVQSLTFGPNFQAVRNYANFLTLIINDYPRSQALLNQVLPKYPYSPDLWMLQAINQYQSGLSSLAASSSAQAVSLDPSPINSYIFQTITGGQILDVDKYVK